MKDKGCVLPRSKRSVHDYFAKGCSRRRDALLPVRGPLVSGGDRLCARYSLGVGPPSSQGPPDPQIEEVQYQATTCAALVAFCELLAEAAEGSSLAEASRITPADLIRALPGVPTYKQDRAHLAVSAFRAAAALARGPIPSIHTTDIEEPIDEGRVRIHNAGAHGFVQARQDDPSAA